MEFVKSDGRGRDLNASLHRFETRREKRRWFTKRAYQLWLDNLMGVWQEDLEWGWGLPSSIPFWLWFLPEPQQKLWLRWQEIELVSQASCSNILCSKIQRFYCIHDLWELKANRFCPSKSIARYLEFLIDLLYHNCFVVHHDVPKLTLFEWKSYFLY